MWASLYWEWGSGDSSGVQLALLDSSNINSKRVRRERERQREESRERQRERENEYMKEHRGNKKHLWG